MQTKNKRNCQCERAVQKEGMKLDNYAYNRQDVDAQKAVQAEGGNPESYTNKIQDADIQNQCSVDNTAKPSVILNPMVMGNNNSENIPSQRQ